MKLQSRLTRRCVIMHIPRNCHITIWDGSEIVTNNFITYLFSTLVQFLDDEILETT